MVPKGAGIIVLKTVCNETKFLGLIGPKFLQEKHNGIFDIPKGCQEEGEDIWGCAVRETYEETSLKICKGDIIAGPFQHGQLTVWCCTTEEEPVLRKNPKLDIYEHDGYKWLSGSELLFEAYSYLVPCVSWAMTEIDSGNNKEK